MKLSFDQTTDYSFRELNKFIKKASHVPQYLEESEVQTTETVAKLSKEAFADPYNRAFPKNTKANTYLSYVHFLNKKASLEDKYNDSYVTLVENNLKSAAQLFEIEQDLEQYTNDFNTKEAADYEEKAIFETSLNGKDIQLFTYKTASELKEASELCARDINKIPFQWRKEICNNFVKHAYDMGLDELDNRICKYAGMFYADPNHVKSELTRRAFRHPSHEAKATYAKLAELVDDYDSNEEYIKTAEIMYALEKSAGLYDSKQSRRIFNDPFEAIFTISLEKVSEDLNVVKVGNDYYRIDDILKVSEDTFQEAFGIDKLADADSIRDIMPTMPLSDFTLFKELSGISSV